MEFPFEYGSLPTHEISILFFKFIDNLGIHTIRAEDKINSDVIDSLLQINQPSSKTISLDMEKAFIRVMQPSYNKQFYNKYPESKDGLFLYNYDTFTYSIENDITLLYEEGEIKCRRGMDAGDFLSINGNKKLEIIKLR